jgi:hypothetical protein
MRYAPTESAERILKRHNRARRLAKGLAAGLQKPVLASSDERCLSLQEAGEDQHNKERTAKAEHASGCTYA